MKVRSVRALLFACLLVWALPSFAGIPTPNCPTPFDPSVDSDAMAVCAPDGTLFAYTSVTEANEDPNAIYVVNGVAPNAGAFGFATTFCEGGVVCTPSSPQSAFSDIYGVAVDSNGNLVLAFSSDVDPSGSPYGNQGFYFISEPNGWKDASSYLDPSLRGYSAFFISQTPEPTTMLLLGSGLGLLARKRRKK